MKSEDQLNLILAVLHRHLLVRDVSVPTAALFMRMSTPPRLSLTHLKAASTSDCLLISHFTPYSLPVADSRDLDSSWNKVNPIMSEQAWILLLTYAMCVSYYFIHLYFRSKIRWFLLQSLTVVSIARYVLITRLPTVSVVLCLFNTWHSVFAQCGRYNS